MTLSFLPIPLRDIALGQIALVACCLVYLAWWCVAFRPGGGSGGGLGYALLAVTIMLAGVGMSLDIAGLRALWDGAAGRMALRILIAGVIAYPLLLLVTMRCFHRVPTTELLLIVAWAVLEALVVTMLVLAGLGRTARRCRALWRLRLRRLSGSHAILFITASRHGRRSTAVWCRSDSTRSRWRS